MTPYLAALGHGAAGGCSKAAFLSKQESIRHGLSPINDHPAPARQCLQLSEEKCRLLLVAVKCATIINLVIPERLYVEIQHNVVFVQKLPVSSISVN